MSRTNVVVAVLSDKHLDSLEPLVDEFVSTHRSLRFKDGYWSSFREWLVRKRKDENALAIIAEVDGKLAGFALATVQENGPLVMPERIGYVSLIVVAPKSRRTGVGDALWNGMRDWSCRGINETWSFTRR